ncbi:MAG: formylglycine-generating enzyme family protein, partial [Gammaproteobacteria bacterium]
DGSEGPEMVVIPAGRFQMGDITGNGYDREKPVHEVSVESFAIGKFEVTVGEYIRFVKATNSHAPEWLEKGSQYNIKTGSDDHYKKLGSALTNENHPIVGVSWNDAVAYTKWLNEQTGQSYRLPTEAEWEYAARAGTETEYWWGNEIDKSQANYGMNLKQTSPVGDYKANPFGLYDTVGNVWEWCTDNWHENYEGAPTDGSVWKGGEESLRVLRGGSWSSYPTVARTAFRNLLNWLNPDNRDDGCGFRVAARIL